MSVPQLPASTLFDVRFKQDKARQTAYNQILEQALQKIAHCATAPNQPTYVYFNVPPFVLGLPSLDLKDCVVYIVYQLRYQGYEVRYTYPNLLLISWAHHERQYLLEKNPIVQSMMPPKMEGPEKRRGASQISLQQAATETPNAGALLRASDYTPPAGCVETMERPSPYQKPKQTVRFSDTADPLANVLSELWKV